MSSTDPAESTATRLSVVRGGDAAALALENPTLDGNRALRGAAGSYGGNQPLLLRNVTIAARSSAQPGALGTALHVAAGASPGIALHNSVIRTAAMSATPPWYRPWR